MRSPAPLLLAALAACSAPRPPDPANVFRLDAADAVFRSVPDAEKGRMVEEVRFLIARYGYEPDGTIRDLRGLKDLLDRGDLLARLREEPALSYGARLRQLGYHLQPTDVHPLIEAAGGRSGEVLADPAVESMLDRVAAAGLLHEDAGRDFLSLRGSRLEDLVELAALADPVDRIRTFGSSLDYRFRPSDAAALVRDEGHALDAGDQPFLAALLKLLGVEARPGYLPELRALAARPEATEDLLRLARDSEVELEGAGAVLVLGRLVRDYTPLTEEERDRFESLARMSVFPDQADFLHLVPLARARGIEDVIDELEDRYRYRFRPQDSRALIRLLREGIPDAELPSWIERDRATISRLELLTSAEPAHAFAGPNDLAFLAALESSRPDLAARPLHRLASEVKESLEGRRVRYRLGAPYPESADDLEGFLRPDLLKILLLIEVLDRPETSREIAGWMRGDARETGSERGGYVRLTPAGRLRFELFEGSAVSGRDDRLLLPPAPDGAAVEFHFHAADADETAFAGPSSGGPGTDLFRARRHRTDGLVLTRLPDGEYDADFYSDRGFVLDLGLHR